MKKPCKHVEIVPDCHWCKLGSTHPGYAKRWGTQLLAPLRVSDPTPALVSLDCIHMGEVLTGPERQALSLDHRRTWRYCGHPEQPLGLGPVCAKCKGCGPGCKGYTRPVEASRTAPCTRGGIPKVIHQIWLGKNPMPQEYRQYGERWKALFPDFGYRLWTDADDYSWMQNEKQFRRAESYSEQSDWLRYAILADFGGWYADTDFEPWGDGLRALVEDSSCWTGIEDTPGGSVCSPGLIGSIPGHPFYQICVADQPKYDTTHAHGGAALRTGPGFFSSSAAKYHATAGGKQSPLLILPAEKIYPFRPQTRRKFRTREHYPNAVAGHHYAGSWCVRPPVMRRHLVMHLLPVSGNGVYQRAIEQLKARWSLFTGHKVIAIATGAAVRIRPVPGTSGPVSAPLALDSVDVVRKQLPPDVQIIEVPNDRNSWEGASWEKLWSTITPIAHDDDAVLYCHAKGVTRPEGACQDWASLLWQLSLDYWPIVAKLLEKKSIVGPFLKPGRFFRDQRGLAESDWHFSGNFWWVRMYDLHKARELTPLPAGQWASEAWAGIAFDVETAGTYGPLVGSPAIDLYNQEKWASVVWPAWGKWIAGNPPSAPPLPVRLSVIVPTTGRTSIGKTIESITSQLLPGDQLLVQPDRSNDWGATPRTEGMIAATGTHLTFMDDDDLYAPGALGAIRSAIERNPHSPLLFRMARRAPYFDILPRREVVERGNVSTQMIVVPNVKSKLGKWGVRYEGDYDFITSTLAHYPPNAVRWESAIIAIWRPDLPIVELSPEQPSSTSGRQ